MTNETFELLFRLLTIMKMQTLASRKSVRSMVSAAWVVMAIAFAQVLAKLNSQMITKIAHVKYAYKS